MSKILECQLIEAGGCYHPEFVTERNGRLRSKRYPVYCALLKHEVYGNILFDVGYSQQFFTATNEWPFKLYRYATPVEIEPKSPLKTALSQKQIATEDIQHVFISHFHADHVCALNEYPQAHYYYDVSGLKKFEEYSSFSGVRKGFLKSVVPSFVKENKTDILSLSQVKLGDGWPFEFGYDVLGDESLLAIPLPGHAWGQMGLYFKVSEKEIFLVADAAWTNTTIEQDIYPHPISNLIQSDAGQYKQTLLRLKELRKIQPHLWMIPSHCAKTYNEWMEMHESS